PDKSYTIENAMPLMQKVKYAKFDETVEITLRLGVDPKHADQMVRGTVVLPHGLGKTKRVLAIAGGEKQKEAKEAGADFVGGEELGIITTRNHDVSYESGQRSGIAAAGDGLQGIRQRDSGRLQGTERPAGDRTAPPAACREGQLQGREEHDREARAQGHIVRSARQILRRHYRRCLYHYRSGRAGENTDDVRQDRAGVEDQSG